ncbi:hypothetical protein SAMN06272735_8607 [Streptomyces sp. TLI_55]|uniref:hypothetical protein n=1 Tax=Streptomyces sp. TLI_55 TaxID=1938861 RepID=UPI000BCC59B7|nr:hypothetical protein [Streptomyces sp. TLI_55]SNX88171.1 hypothetical protein SAMN06272735_8607 [Streptomyces sp. TLI_55]
MTRTWRRLADRLNGKHDPEVLYEGLPDHLAVPVRHWALEALRNYVLVGVVCLRLRLPSTVLNSRAPDEALANYQDKNNPMIFLEIVDALLAGLADTNPYSSGNYGATARDLRTKLDYILTEGGSAYMVNPERDGLCRRVNETLRESLEAAVQAADKQTQGAGTHLREAFSAAYGISPNPSVAYSQSVKAVEAVANPLFLPKSPEPTLGAVRSTLDQGRNKYEMVVQDRTGAPAGINAVVELLNLLWHGQRDRHAGGPTSQPVTQEAAETAVHAAALLVHWIATGAIRKK